MLYLCCTINIQGELYVYSFITYTVLFPDIYELICFKLGTMLDTTELYITISVWMTLTFSQYTGL